MSVVGDPESTPTPPPPSTKPTPEGRVPEMAIVVGPGNPPVAGGLNSFAIPLTKGDLFADVIKGLAVTVSVMAWIVDPAALVAFTDRAYVPAALRSARPVRVTP